MAISAYLPVQHTGKTAPMTAFATPNTGTGRNMRGPSLRSKAVFSTQSTPQHLATGPPRPSVLT